MSDINNIQINNVNYAILDEELTDINTEITNVKSDLGTGFNTQETYFDDLDDATAGSVRYDPSCANKPSANGGFLVTLKRGGSIFCQIAVDATSDVYTRWFISGWQSWNRLTNPFRADITYTDDLDNATIGCIKYRYNALHTPDNTVNGWLITFYRTSSSKTQIAITDNSDIYIRVYTGSWTNWVKNLTDNDIDSLILSTVTGDPSIGRNKYNAKTDLIGHTVNVNTGAIEENSSYNCSDFISVLGDTVYSLTNKYIQTSGGFNSVAYYTSSKTFISRVFLDDTNNYIVTPVSCRYIILLYQNAYDSTYFMFLQGQHYPQKYLPYYQNYNGQRVGIIAQNVSDFVTQSAKDNIVVPYFPIFRFATQLPWSGSMTALKTTDIYSLYDGLMADYPTYITKTALGTASDGQTVYKYDFMPHPMGNNTNAEDGLQKAIVFSGTHGEPLGVICLYYALKTIYDDWKNNEQLGLIRMNTHFVVVPVVSPYSIDHMTETVEGVNLGRVNANGVNINRNFPYKWALSSEGSNYSGPNPLSEPESQIMEALFKSNDDANWATSFHNYGASGYAIWHMDEMRYMHRLSTEHLKRMSASYYKSGETPQTGDYFGYCTLSDSYGNEAGEALRYGIRSGTLEVGAYGNGTSNPYGSSALTMGTENHINWIIMQYYADNSPVSDW